MKTKISTLLLAVFFLNGCQTLTEIDKGLYEAADNVTEKDRITGLRTLSFQDRQAQIETGNKDMADYLNEIKKKNIKINEDLDPAMYARLQNVFSRVHSISHFRDEKWEAILVDDDSFNAFVTGGTYIVVCKGLMNEVSDAELAAVISHEIGHVVANHGFERRTHRIILLIAQSNSAKRDSYVAAFTHEDEREADRIGVLYSALAGFDPYAAHRLWKRKFEESGDLWIGFTNDHPVNSQRSAEAEAVAGKVSQYYSEGSINQNFEKLLVNNSLWGADGIEVAAGEGGGILAVLEATADAMLKNKKAKDEEERQKNKNEFVSAVRQLVTYSNLEVISKDAFRITIHYRGNISINNITFLCVVDNELQIKSDSGGPLQPNGKYYITFQSPKLLNYENLPDSTKIGIVDAR